jgi:FtsP/CotA-like multicopper oxidase with cupredoxin domain
MNMRTALREVRLIALALAIGGVALACGRAGATAGAAPGGKIRTYYVGAVELDWDYAPMGRNEAMGMPFDEDEKPYVEPGPHRIGRVYKKAAYREFTDDSFTTEKVRPPEEQYLGLMGPLLRGEVGDTIRIVFKNKASHPYSMHPHGVFYEKDS